MKFDQTAAGVDHQNNRPPKSTFEIVLINLISYLIFLGIALFILWMQFSHHAFIAGTDSTFHMNRFYETAMQIKEGHFSYFQSLYAFHRTGRIVIAFYGPLMAYLSGILLLICKDWASFQMMDSLIVLSLSGWLMYVLCVKSHVKRWAALVTGAIYMTCYPVSIWATSQKFTGLGAAFLPLAILCGIKMLDRHRVKVLELALVMTLLVQTHVMTTVVAITALIPMFIVGWFHSKNRGLMLSNGLKAAGLTILLSGNVWGSVVDMFTTNCIIPVYPQNNLLMGTVTFYHGYLMFLGPIMTLIVLLVTSSLIFRWRTYDYRWKTVTLIGWLFLWMSSAWFPWKWVHRNWTPVTNVIQFPRRFLIVSIIMFLIAFGQSCSRRTKLADLSIKGFKLHPLKYILLLIFLCGSIGGLKSTVNSEVSRFESDEVLNEPMGTVGIKKGLRSHQIRHAFRSEDLKLALVDVFKSVPDYLPSNSSLRTNQDYYDLHPYYWTGTQLDKDNPRFHRHIIGRDRLRISWRNPRSKRQLTVLPIVAYHQTRVIFNRSVVRHHKISQVGAVRVHARPGINHVTIGFHPDASLRLMMAMTCLAWVGLLVYLGVSRRHTL